MITEDGKKLNMSRLRSARTKYFTNYWTYKRTFWDEFDYTKLSNIMYLMKTSKNDKTTFNDITIMADTETSKKKKGEENHVCAWSIALRAYDRNLVTLWGKTPSDMMKCMRQIQNNMKGDKTIVYFHNLGYDYTFLRLFLFREFGKPIKQLIIKPYLPIYIEFAGGLILRDSLILSGCSLEKWADDLEVEHKKAVGKWDYNKIRDQKTERFSLNELDYIENDVVAGVECIDAFRTALGKKIHQMPWTMTGIVREGIRKRAPKNAHERFLAAAVSFDQYLKLTKVYHGGFVHGNRHYYGFVIRRGDKIGGYTWEWIDGWDFASSYPFCMLTRKFPAEAFHPEDDMNIQDILSSAEDYAYMFKLRLFNVRLKSPKMPMPCLSVSRAEHVVDPVIDNGRITSCAYWEGYCNEVDLKVYCQVYDFDLELSNCVEVECALKDYLPRWITDYVYELFVEKCKLKGKDPILYALAKARLNSLYGLFVQHSISEDIIEEFDFDPEKELYHKFEICDPEDPDREQKEHEYFSKKYDEYISKRNSILNYQIGVWVTSYAFENLFELGKCIDYKNGGQWFYSDTDSIYGTLFDQQKIDAYNKRCKDILIERGYPAVKLPDDEKEYWLGVAEHHETKDRYSEFCFVGAKRYVGRKLSDNKLHLTVAGVPKKGVCELFDDITQFKKGKVFRGEFTGKKLHKHFRVPEIYIDEWGNETGDSIDLSPCDYELDAMECMTDWDPFAPLEIEVQNYDEE